MLRAAAHPEVIDDGERLGIDDIDIVGEHVWDIDPLQRAINRRIEVSGIGFAVEVGPIHNCWHAGNCSQLGSIGVRLGGALAHKAGEGGKADAQGNKSLGESRPEAV